jgi:hypothetical protein
MARKAILETGYTFTPGASGVGSVVIPRVVTRERLILITNVTTNTVIYNFSDSNLRATNYTFSTTGGTNTTTVVLNYNTTGMSSSDKLQIVIDEYDEKFSPVEIYSDPVNKLRVSEPQALIDTDFEYGTQTTKWENLTLINNRPFAFASPIGVGTINYIILPQNSRIVTVGLQNAAPGIGTAILVQDAYLNIANGNFIIESVSGAGNTIFTYAARSTNTTTITNIFDSNKTGIFSGSTYTNAQIGGTPTFVSNPTGIAITVSTTVPHGLAIGNEIAIVGTSTASANGAFLVTGITSSRTFTYHARSLPLSTPTGGRIFVRPQGQFLHRPFDGGVIFTSNANANFENAIRQTRRYFRYQSGKGVQISTGTILKPNLQLDSLTSSGTTVTAITKEQHNIQPGTVISVFGANESAYNGTFTVTEITGFNGFKYTALTTPSATTASGNYNCSVQSWYGSTNRVGLYDSQNGVFFEFDGQRLFAVRRSSTFQLSGKITVTNGSNTVTETNPSLPTYFSKQLVIGDFIVIRGQSYRVIDIASDTTMTITPSYRGTTADFVIYSKTIDTKIPQSQWNIDKCDGTGPSGYNIDLSKMQMWYIDYSWYGAGFIRWGLRATTGDVIYCHKLINNNVNTEAYMRSGNLPARYETDSVPPTTQITGTVAPSHTFVGIASTAGFPPSGTIVIRDNETYEYCNYTGIGTTVITGLTRARSGVLTPLTVTMSAGSNTGTAVTTNIQVGMRVIGASTVGISSFPDGTFISSIGTGTLTFSQAALFANPVITVHPMGATTAQTFTYTATNPAAVELAYPTYGPSISHWGTSVIMDGRYDDDKSLVFTYGQTTSTTLTAGSTTALLSIRVAPSVDNGIAAAFGQRELINRMQLVLRSFGLSSRTASTNFLVRAVLNGVPSVSRNWTNAVGNALNVQNSSLAQICDYAGTAVSVSGGEIVAGFLVSGTDRLDLNQVRDLGNCILGGGGATSNVQIYPDGPDTLTFTVTNISTTSAEISSRISWTEAQA